MKKETEDNDVVDPANLTVAEARHLRTRGRGKTKPAEIITKVRRIALQDALTVWQALAKEPSIEKKRDLPDDILLAVREDIAYCPLCSVFQYDRYTRQNPTANVLCDPRCPLTCEGTTYCYASRQPYTQWMRSVSGDQGIDDRRSAASEIVALISETLKKDYPAEEAIHG